ncbi:hypothetical protein AVEN_58346-1, partial [Araneus ventricosus]
DDHDVFFSCSALVCAQKLSCHTYCFSKRYLEKYTFPF